MTVGLEKLPLPTGNNTVIFYLGVGEDIFMDDEMCCRGIIDSTIYRSKLWKWLFS